jgi:hypothetical protein
MDDVVARGYAVHTASKTLVVALENFTLAVTNLVLPFWSDMIVVVYATWTVLDLRVKGGIALLVVVVYSLIAAYRRAIALKQKHGGAVRAMAFQASFLIAAPMLWFGAPYVDRIPPFRGFLCTRMHNCVLARLGGQWGQWGDTRCAPSGSSLACARQVRASRVTSADRSRSHAVVCTGGLLVRHVFRQWIGYGSGSFHDGAAKSVGRRGADGAMSLLLGVLADREGV